MSEALYERYQESVRDVSQSIRNIQDMERRVQSAQAGINAAIHRSTATQRKARGFLAREKRILEQEEDSRDRAIQRCRSAYRKFCAGEWAKAWGLPTELADAVAYYI